ncbi:MAG TPA: YlbF family regulator [Clostridiaceae bacterium]|nr:YlbF family regulator [Clostridiaceae bacterium]
MDIIEKSKELGLLIRDSEELKKLRECETRLLADENARALFSDYNKLQSELYKAVQIKSDENTIKELEKRISEKEQEIYINSVAKQFLDAKKVFDSLVRNVNSVIMYFVTGEEPCSPEKCSGCKSGCGNLNR